MPTTIQIPREASDFLVRKLEKNLLLYEAGHAVFCPGCGNVMDWKRTVIATIHGTPEGGEGEQVLKKYVQCSQCYERHHTALHGGVETARARMPQCNVRLEIVDGRDPKFRNSR